MNTHKRSAMYEAPPVRASASSPGFVDLDTLTSADGIRAVISQRRKTGELTFAVFRVWVVDGTEERTAFIPESMIGSYKAQVDRAIARMAALKAAGNLPFPATGERGIAGIARSP